MQLKVMPMLPAAERAVANARGTVSGTFIWVGWSSKSRAITAGDKILRSLPHLRVDVAPGDSVPDTEIKLSLAVAQLRKELPKALKNWRAPKPGGDRSGHAWSARGALRRRR